MRVLLLHPEDLPDIGAWSRDRWDLVVDLGFAGPEIYAEWVRKLRCRVISLHQFARQGNSYRWLNEFFDLGRGRLLDRIGLDWWEILAMESYQDLHAFHLFQQLREELSSASLDVACSRPHRLAQFGEQVLGVAVRCFQRPGASTLQRLSHSLRAARNLRFSQMIEIACDKWDSGYDLRRRWGKHNRVSMEEACVLIPSAYSNVTRSALAYAVQLPARRFLLVTTRANANPTPRPTNVAVSSLAAYVQPAKKTHEETIALIRCWSRFAAEMQAASQEFQCAALAGVWDYFPQHLAHGMRLRDAWSSVLESEPVAGVLCGDDLNYHTRLPLILAGRKGLRAVYCSHGALDGGFLFKKPLADCYLVKGEMERDYLQRATAIGRDKIVVGAPGTRKSVMPEPRRDDAIVFFSQPYEVEGGRAESIYREIIPRLYSIANATGRKLIVKLHPFESRRLRQNLIRAVLPSYNHASIEIVDSLGPEQVMARAWCGITVDSSVAVECALSEIPFFLCGWLDFTGLGYLDQFARFGVAQVLRAPDEIELIPQMIANFRPDSANLQKLWSGADLIRLEETLFAKRQVYSHVCAS